VIENLDSHARRQKKGGKGQEGTQKRERKERSVSSCSGRTEREKKKRKKRNRIVAFPPRRKKTARDGKKKGDVSYATTLFHSQKKGKRKRTFSKKHFLVGPDAPGEGKGHKKGRMR